MLLIGYLGGALPELPGTLTHLTLGTNFNQPLENLPNKLTHLHFLNPRTWGMMRKYSHALNKLPESLTHVDCDHIWIEKPIGMTRYVRT